MKNKLKLRNDGFFGIGLFGWCDMSVVYAGRRLARGLHTDVVVSQILGPGGSDSQTFLVSAMDPLTTLKSPLKAV